MSDLPPLPPASGAPVMHDKETTKMAKAASEGFKTHSAAQDLAPVPKGSEGGCTRHRTLRAHHLPYYTQLLLGLA